MNESYGEVGAVCSEEIQTASRAITVAMLKSIRIIMDIKPFDLSGRNVLVTGGTSGIGLACVERLAEYGAKVVATYVEGKEDPKTILQGLSKIGDLQLEPLDLRSGDSIKRCINNVIDQLGSLEVLVNNAAVGSATVEEWSKDTEEQDSLMLQINADGTLKMCRHYLDVTAGAGRKIINLSSVGGGISAFPGFRLSDGMSKAAVAFLSKQLAAETVFEEVDVFAVCPGATDTPMFRASTLQKLSRSQESQFFKRLPKKRLIEASEIAALVHFLATPASTVLHGAVLDASMGLGVRPGLMSDRTS